MGTKQYEYFAFISYKREDEKWAKRLQRKLESYSLPTDIRKENPELPNKIRPVFRDQSELSGGNLKAEIEKGLNGSKYLIVICSPRSAKSPWVSKEVQHFIDQGREEYIIPFIIGGTPNASNPEEECFPEGLRLLKGEKEILGININEMGREAAAIKVIARMFDLRFDSLWQRSEKEKRRNRTLKWTCAIIAIALSLSVAAYIGHQNAQLSKANETIKGERDRANQERNKTFIANKSLKIANDSIKKNAELLKLAYNKVDIINRQLIKSNNSLNIANRNLSNEKKRVETINHNLKINQSKSIAVEVNRLLDEGEPIEASRKILTVIPDENNTSWPYVPEVEFALRRCVDSLYNPSWHSLTTIKHDLKINELKFNNNKLISASNDNKSIIYDLNKNVISNILEHPQRVNCIDVTPDGNQIATGCRDKKIRLFDASTGLCEHEISIHGNPWFMKYNKEGSVLSVVSSDCLVNINPKTGEIISGGIRMQYISSDSFTSDKNDFLLHFNSFLYKLDYDYLVFKFLPMIMSDELQNKKFDENYYLNILQSNSICSMRIPQTDSINHEIKYSRISADGSYITSLTYDSTAYLFDGHKGLLIKEVPNTINSYLNATGSKWLTWGSDNIVRIYSTKTNELITSLKHDSKITSAKFGNNGDFVITTSIDGNARIWDDKYKLSAMLKHDSPIYDCEISDDNEFIAIQESSNTVRLWGKSYHYENPLRLFMTDPFAYSIDFDNKKNMWIGSLDRSISQIDLNSNEEIWRSPIFDNTVEDIHLSNSNKLMSAIISNGKIYLLNPSTGYVYPSYYDCNQLVYAAQFSPDDKHLLLTVADRPLEILNVPELTKTDVQFHHKNRVKSATWLGNDKIISVSADSLFIWDVNTGNLFASAKMDDPICVTSNFSGNKIAVGSNNNKVYLYEARDINKPSKIIIHGLDDNLWDQNKFISDKKIDIEQRDEKWMKSAVSGKVLGNKIFSLFERKEPIQSLSFFNNDQQLLSISDRSAKIWDVKTGVLINNSFKHPLELNNGGIDRSGKYITTIFNSNDKSFLFVWKNPSYQDVIQRLKCKIDFEK